MSENSEFEAEKHHTSEPKPAVEGDSGQYVDGDYGTAGIAGEEPVTVDREYPEGNYGAAGAVAEDAAGAVEGEYEAGDYGKAGTTGENLVTVDDAEYPDGDYGAAGTSGAREEHRLVDDEVTDDEVVEDEVPVKDEVPREIDEDLGDAGRTAPPLP